MAGRGSGKTELARRRTVRYLKVKKPWSNPLYFYAMPTRDQAKRVAWAHIKALVPQHWLAKDGVSETELSITTIYGSKLYVVGMDKPQRIEGEQWDGGVIDESADHKPKSFDLSVLPALSHRNAWCWRIGIPKRFGIGSSEFYDFYDAAEADPDISAFTWKSETILTPEQLKYAKANLDPRDYAEQYEASRESASGGIFYSFKEKGDDANVKSKMAYNAMEPLIIGCDFNVDPLCWVICQIVGDTLFVIDEVYIRNTSTPEGLDHLYARYHEHYGGFHFYGDAAARQRNSAAKFSDYAHIANDTRFANKDIFFPMSNPAKVDRFSATNARFRTADGTIRCYIHSRCRHLIKDLVSRVYRPGSREPDDHGDIGHMSDALGYVIHYIWPPAILQPAKSGQVYIGTV